MVTQKFKSKVETFNMEFEQAAMNAAIMIFECQIHLRKFTYGIGLFRKSDCQEDFG